MWRPIETAPRDGTWVWGFTRGAPVWRAFAVWFFDEWSGYWESPGDPDAEKPTHWLPLPQAPDPETP